jgi:sugar phosphate permease
MTQRWSRVLPLATITYMIAFVNRANISQALPSMIRDLHMTTVEAGAIAGIFFWGYLLLQIPGGYLASHWSAKWFVTVIMLVWGSCAVICGLVNSWREMWIVRLLLGIAEGGMYPATLVLLSHWFPRKERARACAWFIVAIPLSLVTSAPLSGWLLDRWNWRVMLIAEGMMPLLWAIIWVIRIRDYPKQARWLSSREREYLESEFSHDVETSETPSRKGFFEALLNPQALLLALISLLTIVAQLGFLFWLPSAIEQVRNISHLVAGFLYAIPFVVGAISIVLLSSHSDRSGERRGHVFGALCVGGVALISGVLVANHYPRLGFALISLVGVGTFASLGPLWAIITETFPRRIAGSVFGLINGVGNLGGFVGPVLVGYLRNRTDGFVYSFVVLGVALLIAATLVLLLAHRPGSAHNQRNIAVASVF